MIKSLSGSLILITLLFLCSCTKKLYTHQQVMQSMHTKDDVLKKLGTPDEVKKGEDIEEWVYNRDTVHKPGKPKKTDTIFASNAQSDTLKVIQFPRHVKYIRFIFDQQGNIAGYKSQGVDFSYVKKESFGLTALKVLGIAALIAVAVAVDVYGNSDINF